MQWATAIGYAVFTHDLDFGTMLALSGADGPSVVQVRCLNVLPEAIGYLWFCRCSGPTAPKLSKGRWWWPTNAVSGCGSCR